MLKIIEWYFFFLSFKKWVLIFFFPAMGIRRESYGLSNGLVGQDFQGFLNDLQDWELSVKDKDKKMKPQAPQKEKLVTILIAHPNEFSMCFFTVKCVNKNWILVNFLFFFFLLEEDHSRAKYDVLT